MQGAREPQLGTSQPQFIEVVGALSGEPCCQVLARSEWTIRRLRVEIENLDGSPVRAQRLLASGRELSDEDSVRDLLAAGEENSPTTVSLVRLDVPRLMPAAVGRESLDVESGGGISRITWRVSAKRLQGKDKQAISQACELDMGGRFRHACFKVLLCTRHGESFQRAQGRGHLSLKCEPQVPEAVGRVQVCMWVGEGEGAQEPRGSFEHNFARNSLCGLPKAEKDFDFSTAVQGGVFTCAVELTHFNWECRDGCVD